MEFWKTESNPQKQTAFAIVVIVAGCILAYGFRHYTVSSNALAGFLLGILLLVVGISALLTGGKESITIDPSRHVILIENENLFGRKNRLIPFNEIAGARVSEFGKRSNYTVTYYITLRLTTGENYPLFYPAYYDGRWNPSVAEERLRRFETYLSEHNRLSLLLCRERTSHN